MGEPFKLKNGTVLVSTEAPGGIYNAAQLKKIAELCSKELAIVKATEDQRLALFVKESEVQNVVGQLKAMGLGFRNYQDGLHQPVACLGELCDTHEQPALSTATDLSKLLGSIQLQSPLKIGINGCARCCTPCQTLDIAVIGEAGGYRISLGGKTSQVPELATFFAEGVPAKELPRLVRKIVELFQSKAEAGESLQEVLERCGVHDFVAALAPYSQDAAGRDDPFAADSDEAAVEEVADEEVFDAAAAADEELALDDADLALDDEAAAADQEEEEVAPPAKKDKDLLFVASPSDNDDDLSMDMNEDGTMDLAVEELAEGEDVIVEDEAPLLESEDVALDAGKRQTESDDVAIADETDAEAAHEDITLDEEAESDSLLADDDLVLEDDLISIDDGADAGTLDEIRVQADGSSALSEDLSLDDMRDDDFKDDIAMDDLPEEIPEETEEAEVTEESLAAEEVLDVEENLEIEVAEDESFEADAAAAFSDDEIEEVTDEDLAAENPELDEGLVSSAVSMVESESEMDSDSMSVSDAELAIEEESEDVGSSLMSDEEESRFEQNLQASIEEEKKLQEVLPIDTNQQEREAALSLLENANEDVAPVTRIPTPPATLPIAAVASTPSATPTPLPAPAKAPAVKGAKGMELAGVDLNGQTLRVEFQSGAYVDIDLSTLGEGETRPFRFGKKSVVVAHEADGYAVEIDGMKLFYPQASLPAA